MCSDPMQQSHPTGSEATETVVDNDFVEGRFSAAARGYAALLDRSPGRLDIAARLGYLDLLANRPEAAVARLSHVLEQGWRTRSILSHLAEAYCRLGNLGPAALCYQQLGRDGLAGTLAAMAGLDVFRRADTSATARLDLLGIEPLPMVRASVNGIEANLIIDSGAGDCVLDMRFAVSAGVPLGGQEWRDFAGGHRAEVTHAHLQQLDLDAVRIHDLPIQVLDLQPVFGGWFPDTPVHGIIGISVLSLFNCRFDYQAGAFTLLPSSVADPAPQTTPLWLAENRMLLTQADFPALQNALVFLDTGMTGRAFAVPEDRGALLGVEPGLDEALVGTGGAGEVHGRAAHADRLCLGGRPYDDASGLLLPSLSIATSLGFRINALIGHDLVRGSCLHLDFPRMQLSID